MPVVNVDEIKANALTKRTEEVTKAVTSKYKVIAERVAYIQAHLDAYNKKVAAFETDLANADSPEKIMAILEAHKFPRSSTGLASQQQ